MMMQEESTKSPHRVLIADDDAQFLTFARHFLESVGIEADTANDADAAREALGNASYALLIADINMDGNRELELVKELAVQRPDLPVLVVTGEPTVENAVASANLNVAGFLVKPFGNRDFERAVRAALLKAVMVQRSTPAEPPQRALLIEDIEIIKKRAYTEAKPGPIEFDQFVSLTASNIIRSLQDLKGLADGLQNPDSQRCVCHLFECPRLVKTVDALKDAVAVLERTKGAFKSKELGDLRKRLVAVIENH